VVIAEGTNPVTVLGASAVAVTTWNLRTLSLNDSRIRARKQDIVRKLAEENQIVCLLEMRGSEPTIRVWLGGLSRSHDVFITTSGEGEATAGVAFLLQKDFVRQHCATATFASVIGGRAASLLLSSAGGAPLYVFALHSERYNAELIGRISAERIRLHNIVAGAKPVPGIGLVTGDFNFVGPQGLRWEGTDALGITVVPLRASDLWGQRRFSPVTGPLVDFTPVQETHLRHARPRVSSSSSSDEVSEAENIF
jgi:hypothetical protein